MTLTEFWYYLPTFMGVGIACYLFYKLHLIVLMLFLPVLIFYCKHFREY